jgi:hypothetical protein
MAHQKKVIGGLHGRAGHGPQGVHLGAPGGHFQPLRWSRNPRGHHLGEITPKKGGRPSSRALQ